jgi:hypothetical protein
MDIDCHWSMVELRIDRYGRVTVVTPDKTSHEVQYIRNTTRSERCVQDCYDASIILDGLVPDIDYCTTPLILDNLGSK